MTISTRQLLRFVAGSWVLCLAGHFFVFQYSLVGIEKQHIAGLLAALFGYGLFLTTLIRKSLDARDAVKPYLQWLLVVVFLFPLSALAVPATTGRWLILFTILAWFPTFLSYIVIYSTPDSTDLGHTDDR